MTFFNQDPEISIPPPSPPPRPWPVGLLGLLTTLQGLCRSLCVPLSSLYCLPLFSIPWSFLLFSIIFLCVYTCFPSSSSLFLSSLLFVFTFCSCFSISLCLSTSHPLHHFYSALFLFLSLFLHLYLSFFSFSTFNSQFFCLLLM
jgi:hypothetical protein